MGVESASGALVLTAPYQPPTRPTPSDAVQEAPADGEHPVDVLEDRADHIQANLRRLQTMQRKKLMIMATHVGKTVWRDAHPGKKGSCTFVARGESEQVSVPIKVIDTEGNPLEGATVSPSRSGFYTGEQFADNTNAQGMTSLRAPADEPLFLTAKYRWVSGFNRHVIVIPSQISVALITLALKKKTRSSTSCTVIEADIQEMESTLDNADPRAPIRTMIEGWLEEAQEALDEEHALRQRLEEQRHINRDADERRFGGP